MQRPLNDRRTAIARRHKRAGLNVRERYQIPVLIIRGPSCSVSGSARGYEVTYHQDPAKPLDAPQAVFSRRLSYVERLVHNDTEREALGAVQFAALRSVMV